MTKRIDHAEAARRAKALRQGIEFVSVEDKAVTSSGHLPPTGGVSEPDYDPQDIVRQALLLAAQQETKLQALREAGPWRGSDSITGSPPRFRSRDVTKVMADGRVAVVQQLRGGQFKDVIVETKPRRPTRSDPGAVGRKKP